MELICPADRIPNEIAVDISKLDINESIHLSALSLPEGVKVTIRGRDVTVCSIVAPTSVIEEQRAAAAAAAAPAAEVVPVEGAAPAAAAGAAPAAGAKAAPAAGAKAAPAAAPAKK
jgi:large subunit ribosomal protein L25